MVFYVMQCSSNKSEAGICTVWVSCTLSHSGHFNKRARNGIKPFQCAASTLFLMVFGLAILVLSDASELDVSSRCELVIKWTTAQRAP